MKKEERMSDIHRSPDFQECLDTCSSEYDSPRHSLGATVVDLHKTYNEKVLEVCINWSSTKRNDNSPLKHLDCFREVIYTCVKKKYIYIYIYTYMTYIWSRPAGPPHPHTHRNAYLPKPPSTTYDFTNSPRYTWLHRTCPSKHRRLLQHASQISSHLRGSKKVKRIQKVSEMSAF